MGRAILAQADGVVGPDIVGIGRHQRAQADSGVLVLGENKEGAAVNAGIAVQSNTVHDRRHRVLANAEVEVAAIRLSRPHIGGNGCGAEGVRALNHGVIGAGKVSRATPHLRKGSGQGLDGGLRGLAGGQRFTRFPHRQFSVEILRQFARLHAVKECLVLRIRCSPFVELLLPRGVLLGAALAQLAGVCDDLVVDVEAALRIEAQDLLGGSNFVIAQRSAMNAAGIHLIRGRVADDGLHADEGRALGLCLCGLDGLLNSYDVFAGFDRLDVPAVGLVAGDHVFVESNIRIVLNRDAVIVPEDNQVAQLLRTRQGRGLSGYALLQVTIGSDGVDVVVEGRLAGRCLWIEKPALLSCGHGHAHGGSQALAKGASGDFHAIGVVHLRVTWGARTPRTQLLEIVHLQAKAAQVELDVLGEGRVTNR